MFLMIDIILIATFQTDGYIYSQYIEMFMMIRMRVCVDLRKTMKVFKFLLKNLLAFIVKKLARSIIKSIFVWFIKNLSSAIIILMIWKVHAL